VTLTKKFCLETPSWQEILNNLNHCIINNLLVKNNQPGFYVGHNAELIPKVKKVHERLKAKTAHLFINFHLAKTFGTHKDTMDVAFWQIKGITRWIIAGEEFIVNEGDLITVNKGIEHSVTPLTPRAGISFEV
jgi:mannose-6-phosphate isomerase-like protein (cupin superfamily)